MSWVLVASRVGARIVLREGDAWSLLEEISNDAGRLRNREIDSDRPGRTFSRTTAARHALAPAESSHDLVAERFAGQLADHLRHARTEGKLSQLVLVAEPRLLGMLRSALDPVTSLCVIGSVAKDLHDVRLEDLPGHLL